MLYPDVHSINQQQEATVEEVWINQQWNLTLRKQQEATVAEVWINQQRNLTLRRMLLDCEVVGRPAESCSTLKQFKGHLILKTTLLSLLYQFTGNTAMLTI